MIHVRREPTFESAGAPAAPLPRRRTGLRLPLALAVVVLLAVLAWQWWTQRAPHLAPAPATPRMAAVEDAPPPAPAAAPAIRAPAPVPQEQRLSVAGIPGALEQSFGRDAVLRFLQLTDFPRRAVATIDALGRDHAAVSTWPVQTTPGRFETEDTGTGQRIGAANSARYQPFVDFATGIDPAQAAALYRRLYPVLQQAYRELGFGDRDLNERVLQVIDLLLATPEPQGPLPVQLTEVRGPYAAVQPWTRYAFSDPDLQALAAGQKILLRVGPENRARLKAQLRALRQQLAKGAGVPR
jgi:hypothetical protein